MKLMKFLSLAVVLFLLTGAGERKVQSEGIPDYNFSSLKTYEWAPTIPTTNGDPRLSHPELDKQIREAVNQQLAAKGFVPATDKNPDFWVNYQAAIVGKLDVEKQKQPYFANVKPQRGGTLNSSWNAFGNANESNYRSVTTYYEQGTLVIDIADAKERKLVWRGAISDTIQQDISTEKRKKNVNTAVADVLKLFPPKTK